MKEYTFEDFINAANDGILTDFRIGHISPEEMVDIIKSGRIELPLDEKLNLSGGTAQLNSIELLSLLKNDINWKTVVKFNMLIPMNVLLSKELDSVIDVYMPDLCKYRSDDITLRQVETYKDRLNWANICKNKHVLIPEFIDQYRDYVDWRIISMTQVLPVKFMIKYKDRICWDVALTYQPLLVDKSIFTYIDDIIDPSLHRLLRSNRCKFNEKYINKIKTDRCKEDERRGTHRFTKVDAVKRALEYDKKYASVTG
jgi:hypothetical protein